MERSPKGLPQRVAVIGAGPSGLAALKSLIEEGHEASCFEKAPDIGGVYRYADDNIGVYASAQLTSSAFITSYSDFPPPANAPFHFKHKEYLQYLRDYAGEFGLMSLIKFNHAVLSLEQLPQGTWRLKAFDHSSQKEVEYIFDAIAVCAGVHQKISIPDLPRQKNFQGSIIHSGHYKTADAFKDKDVVIVGGGESASDIVEEVSQVSRRCTLSLRRGVLIVPRLIFGKPNDFYTTRLFYTVPPWLLRERHKSFHWPSLLVFYLLIVAAAFFFIGFILWALHLSQVLEGAVLAIMVALLAYLLVKDIQYIRYIGPKESMIMNQLNLQSQAGHGEQFATKCQGIAKAIASKKCILKKGIKGFTKNGVIFEDDTVVDADAVIFCTGYVTTYPFLGIERLDCRGLYKNCFDSRFGGKLCFIGTARPAIGAIPVISEMQARWFAQVLSGSVQLPPADAMRTEIDADAQRHKQMFAVVSDRITGLVDFTSYMDELAGFIGCRPQWKDLCREPLMLFRVYFNPFLACQYRLRGPHSKKELARRIMATVPASLFQFMFFCFYLSLISICASLDRLGFRYFKPKLPL